MLERLGDVLYWFGSGTAVVFLALGGALNLLIDHPGDRWFLLAICGICAAVAWLMGRACRYVLGGK
jgi:hypothetical protein